MPQYLYNGLIMREELMTIKQTLERQIQVDLEAFLLHGGVVTVCKTRAPRKNERTFTAIKGSIANMGHQSSGLKLTGAKVKLRG